MLMRIIQKIALWV